MGEAKPCSVCKKMTSKLLFEDRELNVAMCSKPCESEYMRRAPSDPDEQVRLLRYFDDKVKQTKRHENESWAIAGFGLLIVAAGLFMRNVQSFSVGIFPMTLGALSTSYFADKRNKLIKLRMRIRI
jgi:hypothetical protein